MVFYKVICSFSMTLLLGTQRVAGMPTGDVTEDKAVHNLMWLTSLKYPTCMPLPLSLFRAVIQRTRAVQSCDSVQRVHDAEIGLSSVRFL